MCYSTIRIFLKILFKNINKNLVFDILEQYLTIFYLQAQFFNEQIKMLNLKFLFSSSSLFCYRFMVMVKNIHLPKILVTRFQLGLK